MRNGEFPEKSNYKKIGVEKMQKYFLGVDGGNTKSDYLLCTIEGKLVDIYRTGTCSHECFDDGYDGMERVMREHLEVIFSRNNITIQSIEAAGFGLAGADLPYQYVELKKRVENIGFKKYGLANDGILGIKGASESGIGMCAVNGTGTVVLGINKEGEILQIGGVGQLAGDFAGGGYIRDQIITKLYEYHYRCGKNSIMFEPLLKLLGFGVEDLITLVSHNEVIYKYVKEIIIIGAEAAIKGDEVAKSIFDGVGISIAKSAAGCINHLKFNGYGTKENPIDIVFVGSIWNKVPYTGMREVFTKTVEELSGKCINIITSNASAAAGGALWGKEIADEKIPSVEYRKKLMEAAGAFNVQ